MIKNILENQKITDQEKERTIILTLKNAKSYTDLINSEFDSWKNGIRVSAKDFNEIDPYKFKRKKYTFIPTLPISTNALIVEINEYVEIDNNGLLYIKGTTNLYDEAKLMISIRDTKGILCRQDHSVVENGNFSFGPFNHKESGLKAGFYSGNISLSIPNLQPKEFTEKSGIEYEKIDGPLVDRNGSGPVVNYVFSFSVK